MKPLTTSLMAFLICATPRIGLAESWFKRSYAELRGAEEGSSTPLYDNQTTQASAEAAPLPERLTPDLPKEIQPFEEILRKVRESWEQGALAQPGISLFFDSSSEEAQKANNLAWSPELDSALAQPVSMELLLALTFERNPKLAAMREAWRLAVERYARGLYFDGVFQQYGSVAGRPEMKAGLLPLPDADYLPVPQLFTIKAEIAHRELLIAAKKFEVEARDMLSDAREAYYDYVYIRQALRITRETEDLLDDFEGSAQKPPLIAILCCHLTKGQLGLRQGWTEFEVTLQGIASQSLDEAVPHWAGPLGLLLVDVLWAGRKIVPNASTDNENA